MCQRVKCSKCGKATYAGCGAHVEQVLRGVPPSERCSCGSSAKATSGEKPAGWWSRIW